MSREQKDLEFFTSGKRAGFGKTAEKKDPIAKLKLGDIEQLSVKLLEPNPLNPYPALTQEQLSELVADIKDKGVIVPLIARPDGVLLCGHNRLKAAIQAGLKTVPVQTVLHPKKLGKKLQLEIMHSENDKRRGGNWSKAEKLDWIQKHFGAELLKDRRGGNHKSKKQKEAPLEKQIEKKSKGKITSGTAKRLLAELRKKAKKDLPAKKTGKKTGKSKAAIKRRMADLAAEMLRLKERLKEKQAEYQALKDELAKL